MRQNGKVALAAGLLLVAGLTASLLSAQDVRQDRKIGLQMLEGVSNRIRQNYYDPSLRGMNWDRHYAEAQERIRNANSAGHVIWHIYLFVRDLGDSHTIYIPPRITTWHEYGWKLKFYGDGLYVDELEEGGAAQRAGLRVGDRIRSIAAIGQTFPIVGTRAARGPDQLIVLMVTHLIPPPEVGVVVSSPGREAARYVRVTGRVQERPVVWNRLKHQDIWQAVRDAESHWLKTKESRTFLVGDAPREKQPPAASTAAAEDNPAREKPPADAPGRIGYLKMPTFSFDRGFGSRLVKSITEYDALIIDLRGNPGGILDTLEDFTGFFEAGPVEIGRQSGRKKEEPIVAKPRRPNFSGPLVLLVDSETASAAEIFARHFQRQGRAKVVGDQTAGAVVVARIHPGRVGSQYFAEYAVQVSIAQFVMPDGEKLEGKGVTPDYLVVPTGEDLAENRDPALVKATEVACEMLLPRQEQAAAGN